VALVFGEGVIAVNIGEVDVFEVLGEIGAQYKGVNKLQDSRAYWGVAIGCKCGEDERLDGVSVPSACPRETRNIGMAAAVFVGSQLRADCPEKFNGQIDEAGHDGGSR